MRAYLSAAILFILMSGQLHAQNYPVYNAYFVNPYLYNPAAVGTSQAFLFLHHRQQWTNVEGAPQLSAISYNTLIDQSRSGYGIKLSSYKRGLLNTTDVSLSYAYSVPLSQNNYLSFGLSAGAISNSVDFKKATNPNDPALTAETANGIQPAANFGILLQSSSGLNFGIVLPQLFSPAFAAPSFSGTSFSPLDNVIGTLGYKKIVESKLVRKNVKGAKKTTKTDAQVAPLELYFTYKYAKAGNNQFEALGKLNLSDNFWVAAGYRQDYGLLAHTGLNFNKFMIGYSFELANQPEAGFSSGSHEIFLGLKIGQPKKFKKAVTVLRSALKSNIEQQHQARFRHKEEIESTDSEANKKATKQHYIVVASFADFAKADTYKTKLTAEKYNADVFYNKNDRKYYVYVFTTTKLSDAHDELKNLKTQSNLKTARILTIEIIQEN
jgi:type IX secretion system PorP/SprF family membrane protein